MSLIMKMVLVLIVSCSLLFMGDAQAGVKSVPEDISNIEILERRTLDYRIKIEAVAEGLNVPWSLVFLDHETLLVSERVGSLRLIKNGKLLEKAIADTPRVEAHAQGGLLDIALHPEYKSNGWIYLSYSHALPVQISTESAVTENDVSMLRIVRGRIRENTWVDEEVIYQAEGSQYSEPAHHYGGRLLFDQSQKLYFSIGDRGVRQNAQDLSIPQGKIHRLVPNGGIPKDNPFLKKASILESIFSYGHRNPQGLALNPVTGEIWATEHGPRGGDELNIIQRAGNYGWPLVSYGINYDGTTLTPHTKADGTEQPVFYWRPSIGVSGLTFYQGKEFPLWQGKLLVTALRDRNLRLLTIENDRVLHEEILIELKGRPYEPVVGSDGAIYLVVDSPGRVLRITALAEEKQ